MILCTTNNLRSIGIWPVGVQQRETAVLGSEQCQLACQKPIESFIEAGLLRAAADGQVVSCKRYCGHCCTRKFVELTTRPAEDMNSTSESIPEASLGCASAWEDLSDDDALALPNDGRCRLVRDHCDPQGGSDDLAIPNDLVDHSSDCICRDRKSHTHTRSR